MSRRVNCPRSQCLIRAGLIGLLVLFAAGGWWLLPAQAQTPADHAQLVKGANFKQAYKYSPEFLRQFVYSTSVTPNWIGKTDAFWYQFNTSAGWSRRPTASSPRGRTAAG